MTVDLQPGDEIIVRLRATVNTTMRVGIEGQPDQVNIYFDDAGDALWIEEDDVVEVVKTVPRLPTEPGVYLGTEGYVYTLLEGGRWLLGTEFASEGQLRRYPPSTRLVPETAVSQ